MHVCLPPRILGQWWTWKQLLSSIQIRLSKMAPLMHNKHSEGLLGWLSRLELASHHSSEPHILIICYNIQMDIVPPSRLATLVFRRSLEWSSKQWPTIHGDKASDFFWVFGSSGEPRCRKQLVQDFETSDPRHSQHKIQPKLLIGFTHRVIQCGAPSR